MMADSRNPSPENSDVPFRESESLKEDVNQCVGEFYLSHHELLMDEFRWVLNERYTGCQTYDRNQFGHELCLLASVQEQVNICFEEAYNRVNWDQVFQLCQEKLSSTDSYDLCRFLPVASAEMGAQEDRYKRVDERITHRTIHVYELLQTSVILGYRKLCMSNIIIEMFAFAINIETDSLHPSFLSHHGCMCIETMGNQFER